MYRNRGYASELINAVIAELDKISNQPTYFLYADISSEFYLKFGFSKLDQTLQKYKESTCMIR